MISSGADNLKSAVEITAEKMRGILKEKGSVRVAVDGRCGSGKSTFARLLKEEFDCNLFCMDDFYLPPEKRTEERYKEPGGNVDRERFLKEVLEPVAKGKTVFYRVYDCGTKRLKEPVKIQAKNVVITEGSYSCHPELSDFYDLHIFLTVSSKVQMERIINRNGQVEAEKFKNKWIPLEEKYFKYFKIQEKCDIIIELK
ncbi:MAG: uridine kinase [Acutalibacteraceae bacterium]